MPLILLYQQPYITDAGQYGKDSIEQVFLDYSYYKKKDSKGSR